MRCCANCFWDVEIKAIIETNSTEKGKCDFCNSENSRLLNPLELADSFQILLDVYLPSEMLEGSTPIGELLHLVLLHKWSVFRLTDPEVARRLLFAICEEELKVNPDLFQKPVLAECLYNPLNAEQAEIQQINWDNFVREIKQENRYFLNNTINTDLLSRLFSRHVHPYRKGKVFYRGRVSDKEGFPVQEMGKPPGEKTKGGRANPLGISYLYLASDLKTTFYEVRAGAYDYVTVGEFKLLEDIQIINLRDLRAISPFQLQDDLADFIVHQNYLKNLSEQLSKPLRRQDSQLDYLPTQYLCEFIKSKGFHGVEYASSQNPAGFNIAIFDDSVFECVQTYVHEIKSIDFQYNPV